MPSLRTLHSFCQGRMDRIRWPLLQPPARCGRYGWSGSGKRRCRKCRCRRGGEAVDTGVSRGVRGNAVGVGVSVDVGEDMGMRGRITVEVDCGAVVAVVMGVDTGVTIGIEVAKGIESG